MGECKWLRNDRVVIAVENGSGACWRTVDEINTRSAVKNTQHSLLRYQPAVSLQYQRPSPMPMMNTGLDGDVRCSAASHPARGGGGGGWMGKKMMIYYKTETQY